MNPSSLRLRLIIAWAVFIFVGLQVAAVGLKALFERSITRRTIAELHFDLDQLAKAVQAGDDGEVRLARRGPTDPQFEVPDGGRYWQVDDVDREILASASLAGRRLQIHTRPVDAGSHVDTSLIAPNGKPLIAVARRLTLTPGDSGRAGGVVLTSAVNASEIKEDTEKFGQDLVSGLGWLATFLLLGAWAHVTIGLRPLQNIRASLAAIRAGTSARIEGTFPSELGPLIDETNDLLDAQDRAMEAARARAADLAHGLKTPLAIMAAKSRLLRRKGSEEIADDIDRQIETMRRHVRRELARARARGITNSARNDIDVSAVTRELIAAIKTLPRASTLEWQLSMQPAVTMPIDRADLNDMVGNLLDNAQKWANSKVLVDVRRHAANLLIRVEDDGPGLADEHIERVLRRGEKVDSTRDGSGLGLAIVGDLVELYGGQMNLSRGALGGLAVEVTLPDRRSEAPGNRTA